jgi:hypothetical protein
LTSYTQGDMHGGTTHGGHQRHSRRARALDDCDAELERCLIEFVGDLSSTDGPIELW